MIVELSDPAAGFHVVLNAKQTRAFLDELARTKRRRPTARIHPGAAPDCEILVRPARGRQRYYRIYGRSILHDELTRKSWQFYMGLLLVEWLTEPYLAAAAPVPFQPVTP